MKKKIDKEQLIIPIYLNEKTVLDMLAKVRIDFRLCKPIRKKFFGKRSFFCRAGFFIVTGVFRSEYETFRCNPVK